jgi:hypothetical protein
MLANNNHEVWASGAGFMFILGDKTKVGVAVASSDDPRFVYVTMRTTGNGSRDIVSRAKVGEWIDVTAQLDPTGKFTVWSAGKSKTVPWTPQPILSRQLHCQSGTWELELITARGS